MNGFVWGPVCFVIAFLFYSSSKMLPLFESRLRDPGRSFDPAWERYSRILRYVFLGAAVCFCLAGIVFLFSFGLER
ncbi:MAG TPA: hypothetical protein PK597_07155 [Oscillospiraceae bacterium]|nr:hypothetical protein [Oscillospiraceae bacterium]